MKSELISLLLLLLLLSYNICNGSNSCENILFDSGSTTIIPTGGNEIVRINYVDEMIFSMDITINSLPTGWASIFHCGSSDSIRQPGIWIHPQSGTDNAQHESFHISYSTVNNWNPWKQTETDLVIGETYSLKIHITQTSLQVSVNDIIEITDDNYDNHNIYTNQPCYASDPWYAAADVSIENLIISEIITQDAACSYS